MTEEPRFRDVVYPEGGASFEVKEDPHTHEAEGTHIDLSRPYAVLFDSDADRTGCEVILRQDDGTSATITISGTYDQQLDLYKDLVALLRSLEVQANPIDVRFY